MTARFAPAFAVIAALACGTAAQRDTFDRHRELTAALAALDKLEQVAASLRAHGLREAADAVEGARPALTTTVDALRDQLGPPRLSLVTIIQLGLALKAQEASGSATPEHRALLAECEAARARLTDRRNELDHELRSLEVRLAETADSLRAARINETDWVESTERRLFKLRRMHARLANLWFERLSIEISPALAHYFRESLRDSTATRARIESAILDCKSVATAPSSRPPDAARLRSFATRVLRLRDLVLYAAVDDRPIEGDELVRRILQIGTTVPPATLELRYRIPQTVDRDRVIDVFTRRLVALAIDPEQTQIDPTEPRDVVVTVADPRVDATLVKGVLAQRGSILLAWEATRKELEAAGLRVDVNTFAKADRPVPLFANAADPRRPPNPEASAAFCYYPAEPAHPRGAPTPGCIVAVEPEATFADTDIALLSHGTRGFQEVVSLEMTESQRGRMLRVTEARRGRLLCLIINDRLVSSAIVNGPLPGRVLLGIDGRDLIRTLVASHGAGVLTAAPRLISERVIAVADTVDFSLPPREGTTLRIKRTLVQHDRVSLREKLSTTFVDESIHRVDTVVDGQVARATRTFETSRVRPGRGGRPAGDAMATPMQGAAVIVSWDGAQSTISVVRDGKTLTHYGETGQWARNRTVVTEMRRPVVPLGRGVHAVGESWSLDADAVLSALHGGALTPSADRTATARLVSVDDTPAGRVAHIDLRARIPVGSGAVEWTADVRYNVTHRVVVRCVAKGRSVKEGDDDAPSAATFELTVTTKVTSRPF